MKNTCNNAEGSQNAENNPRWSRARSHMGNADLRWPVVQFLPQLRNLLAVDEREAAV
jgi:hypothetical protein